MKNGRQLLVALMGGIICVVRAQDTASPAVSPSQALPASRTNSSSLDSDALNYLYNRAPADGSAGSVARDQATEAKAGAESKKAGIEALMGADSLITPEFERFLSQEEVEPERLAKYLNTVDVIGHFLKERKPVDAWRMLFVLSESEWDANLGKEIANRVRAIWDSSAAARKVIDQNLDLQKVIRRSNWNADAYAESIVRQREARSTGKGKGAADPVGTVESLSKGMAGTMKMTEEYFTALDSKAKIKLNEVKIEAIGSKAKTDLAEYVSTLFKDQRYIHAVMAADFYHALFVDGDLPPALANVSTASLEVRHNITRAVDVVRYKLKKRQIVAATEILRQAFAQGDNMPEMLALPRDAKLKIVEFYTELRRMRNMVEARDFENLDGVLDKLEGMAADFDTTKPRKLVQTVKLESQIRLGNARLAAQEGNQSKALAEFKMAAQIWPGNPELQKAASNFFDSQDRVNIGMTEFDRLFADGQYRKIVEQQLAFLPGLANQPAKQEQMKVAVEKVRAAEMAVEKSNILAGISDFSGAWEALDLASREWNNDEKLNRLRTEYAMETPEFVSALQKASGAERRNEYGHSLSWFLTAQGIYPPSKTANDAIKRLADRILAVKDPMESKQKPENIEKAKEQENLSDSLGKAPSPH